MITVNLKNIEIIHSSTGSGSADLSNYYTKAEVNNLIPKSWDGTQAEYDALGEYDDNITYNILES